MACDALRPSPSDITFGDEVLRRPMAAFGQINEFRPGSERLSVYLERFELYVVANSVPEEKKVPLFLTLIKGTMYSLLHDLLALDSPVN